jgi:hydroxymethylbilane synthase
MLKSHIKIATRKSPLAVKQAEIVQAELLKIYPDLTIELIAINTSGDANQNISLADIGGKGLFSKELEEALLTGAVDIAVHSLKDMETNLRPKMTLAAVLQREDPRDVFISHKASSIMKLPKNAVMATSSVRREAQIKLMRPDIKFVSMRGNIATRLQKLDNENIDATMLAFAGLKRLGLEAKATDILDVKDFIPAVGQGVIAIECLENNYKMLEILAPINHQETYICALTERAMLKKLDGSCKTPIAGYATSGRGFVQLEGFIANGDGTYRKTMRAGAVKDAENIGLEVAEYLLHKA